MSQEYINPIKVVKKTNGGICFIKLVVAIHLEIQDFC